jgi:hypothetical protein
MKQIPLLCDSGPEIHPSFSMSQGVAWLKLLCSWWQWVIFTQLNCVCPRSQALLPLTTSRSTWGVWPHFCVVSVSHFLGVCSTILTLLPTFITLYSIFTVVTEGKLSLHHIMCLLTHFFRDIILLYHMGTYLIFVCVLVGYVISCRRVQWLSTLSDSCICCLRIMFSCKRDQRLWLMGKLCVSDQGTYQL